MADQNDILSLVLAEDVKSVDTKQIDAAIDRIIQESSKNYDEIGELVLECSAALSSAQSRSSARLELFSKRRGLVDDGRRKPFKYRRVGFVEQLQSFINIPTVDVQHIVDRQFDHIA